MIDYAPFGIKQRDYINRTFTNWLNVAEGGKRAGKNITNLVAWATCLETHPDKLHLAAGVSIASAKLNIIDSNGFGLKYWFEGRCRQGQYQQRDALYIDTSAGRKIVLISGGGKEGDEKSIKGNSYGTVYATEVNECAPMFVKEIFDRTISSSDRKLFFDLNPKAPNHSFYVDVLNFHQNNAKLYENYGLNYEHFTLYDNLSLTDAHLTLVLLTYNKDSIWFKRDIMGMRVQAQGAIYDMFNDSMMFDDDSMPFMDTPHKRYYAIDYGTTNACVYLEVIEIGMYSYVMDEYYYDSKVALKQQSDNEYVQQLATFIGDKRYFCAIIDPSAASFKVACRNKGIRCKDADNDVLDGIRLVADMFTLGRLKVHRRCKNLVAEIENYLWNIKASENGKEQPVKQFDHGCDALRYYCKTIIKRVR